MSSLFDLKNDNILKIAGISVIALALNHLIATCYENNKRLQKESNTERKINGKRIVKKNSKAPSHLRRLTVFSQQIPTKRLIHQKDQSYEKWSEKVKEFQKKNNNFTGIDDHEEQLKDGLKVELTLMTKALCDLEKVSNLIVDLQLGQIDTYPCPLIAHKPKKIKSDPYLQTEAIVKPGAFLIKKCVFKPGQQMGNERKYMRAGPRNTQFFDSSKVKADIVVLGKLCPGINTIIRELTIMLKQVYKVHKVFGVKNSFQGYYDWEAGKQDESSILELQVSNIETVHHHGGCFLGMRKTEFNQKQIVDNLQKRGINQVYLIGASGTLKSASLIYEQIKKRKLAIGICVLLKAINRDVALFDTCFGFQSAVQETQRFIEMSYVSGKAYHNTVALVKVPGFISGFLACDAVCAARNVNICLVPEFPYCFYGEKGLLRYICQRIKHKGSCVIVYSEGTFNAAIDIQEKYKDRDQFDTFFQQQITKELNCQCLVPNEVLLMDSNHAVRSIPANSLDTKLCWQLICQVAHSSINCMMSGYTNFVCGHFSQKNAMVPIPEMMEVQNKYQLTPQDEDWQRLLATTGQPSFLSCQNSGNQQS